MTRVATIPLQRIMSAGMQNAQAQLATTQAQLSTGKRATSYATLGTDAIRNLSAHTLSTQQDAFVAVNNRVGVTLSLYDTNLNAIDTSVSALKTALYAAVGGGDTSGLQDSINSAFADMRSALNASEGGVQLFGGSQTTGDAFTPTTLSDLAGGGGATAFANDNVHASARAAAGVDVQYGITASDVATGLTTAFGTLADAGAIGTTPTVAQLGAFLSAIGQIDSGLTSLRAANATNGLKQVQVDTLGTRAQARGAMMADIISKGEDADLGQIAIDLAQQKTTLQASYSVFAQLSSMSLVSYLK